MNILQRKKAKNLVLLLLPMQKLFYQAFSLGFLDIFRYLKLFQLFYIFCCYSSTFWTITSAIWY